MDHVESASEQLRASATDLLLAVDEGRPAGPVARQLAVDVLRLVPPDSPPWLLAVTVLEGGPLRMRRSVELAGLVLDLVGCNNEENASRDGVG